MKKLLWLSLIFVVNTVAANTDETTCIDIIQHAVSQRGECKEFATPCEVPADWKKVSSCGLIKDNKFGSTLEDRMKKRMGTLRRNGKSQRTTKNNNVKRTVKRGISRLRQSTRKTQRDTRKEKTGKSRTFTRKNYSSASLGRVRYLNKNKGGYQHDGDTTSTERKERRQYQHKTISRASRAKRTGKLSNKAKWSTQVEYRKTAGVGLRRWGNSHRAEMHRQVRTARKERVYEGPTLKKVWKGSRIEGDLLE